MDVPLLAEDLAPGDRHHAAGDFGDVRVRRVCDPDDVDFAVAYSQLFGEFGWRGEMERRQVICERLAWDPARPVTRAALAYEMLTLRRGGEIAALRDHTAAVRLDDDGRPLPGPIVVHLSHALVHPPHRGSGLAAWLRALPLQTARRCAASAGCAAGTPVVLVAEMEPRDEHQPARMARLRSYERAGFQLIDPSAAPYAQPDFGAPDTWEGAAPRAISLGLVVRRVGREGESTMPPDELRAVVEAVYAVYGVHVPAAALDPLRADAARYTSRPGPIPLLPPTA